jgi:pyruvyltransferase
MALKFPLNTNIGENQVFLSYDKHRNNLGDILNPIIAQHFGSKEVKRISKRNCKRFEHYFMIGSILQRCTDKSIIWGSGLISEKAECQQAPKKILAVRGPLTRKKLIEQGISCPEIFGDPALLLPEIYPSPNKIIKYKLGIIPHFNDKNDAWLRLKFLNQADIKIIDIQNKYPLKVVDEMLSCEKIISSSLHGIIIADAYKIPSVWIEFEKPFEDGHFKFQDYFHSVSRSVEGPVKINEFKSLNDIINVFEPYSIKIDLELLKNSFPY